MRRVTPRLRWRGSTVLSSDARRGRVERLLRALSVVLAVILVAVAVYLGVGVMRERAETERMTARFDPPVMAGQNFITGCAGGFYARHESTIVLLISAHCFNPGDTLRDAGGQAIGVVGPRAALADCPEDRFCAPSDIQTLALAPDRIAWGHLNMVDMGAGGYRTIDAGTRPLGCSDIAAGDRYEINGREHFRSGIVIGSGPYHHETDTIFPCMIVGDTTVTIGDSGAAVLVNGLPAGIIARQLGNHFGFTPLAEGLENLDLTLCTTPDCDLAPDRVVQP